MARILVVEDNKINQLVALRMLDKVGFPAEVAGAGDRAIAMVTANPFDLILMDCQMPVMDGFETTRAIRDLECADGRVGTPIIAVSAVAGDADRDQAMAAGMDAYLTKPMRIEDLQNAVERWLGVPAAEWNNDVSQFAVRD